MFRKRDRAEKSNRGEEETMSRGESYFSSELRGCQYLWTFPCTDASVNGEFEIQIAHPTLLPKESLIMPFRGKKHV